VEDENKKLVFVKPDEEVPAGTQLS
jgi:hypothetical protein